MIKPVGSNSSIQEFLTNLVRDKTVLDVGCVEHNAELEKNDTWLHKNLRKSAKRVLGLDYSAKGVAELNSRGYEIVYGDAMTMDVGERFDIVTAGEIIEHVENPGALLRNLKRHLNPGGLLVITTPHVFYALHFVESLVASPQNRWNEEHVSWFCYFTLENMLTRCGLEVEQCWYMTRSRKVRQLLRGLHLRCPGFLASSLVMIARDRSPQDGQV
jgi:2-polyprenyl-3-methyl-5-hydroxy-6-metoxy-1,4-benzoquinol methylase